MKKEKKIWPDKILALFPAMALVLGLIFIWLGGQISHLTCLRQKTGQVDCVLERRFLRVVATNEQALPQLTAAELKRDCTTDGCVYWLELVSKEKPVRFTPFSSYNRRGVAADQQEVEQFLATSALREMALNGSPSWTLLIVGVFLVVVGGGLIIFL